MSETFTALASWDDPRRPVATDAVNAATWQPIKQADANRDEYLRQSMLNRLPGGPGSLVWQFPLAVVADGSLYLDYRTANQGTPSTPFGHRVTCNGGVTEGYARFVAKLPAGGYLSSVGAWIVGSGTAPSPASNRPRAFVVHGAVEGLETELQSAGFSGELTNTVASWGDVYPLLWTLSTPRPATDNRLVEMIVYSGIGNVAVTILGVEATIVGAAS